MARTVDVITVAVVLSALLVAAGAAGCAPSQDSSCCPNIDYDVFGPLAGSACRGLEPVFKEVLNGLLKNASHECREAYVDTTCIVAIPVCCSSTDATVFRPCRSLCENLMDKCGNTGHDLQDCNSTIWYDAPCNDGNGDVC